MNTNERNARKALVPGSIPGLATTFKSLIKRALRGLKKAGSRAEAAVFDIYRDRTGRIVVPGDIVATAITINHGTFGAFSFALAICRRRADGVVILDGVFGWQELSTASSNEICVITHATDLRSLQCEFYRQFHRE